MLGSGVGGGVIHVTRTDLYKQAPERITAVSKPQLMNQRHLVSSPQSVLYDVWADDVSPLCGIQLPVNGAKQSALRLLLLLLP